MNAMACESTTLKIKFLSGKGKNGHTIFKREYEMISTFIVGTLTEYNQLNLFELLDKCNEQFGHKFGGDAAWYVLNIKHDLQRQGIINVKKNRKHIQLVSLKAQKINSDVRRYD